jgi:hypothetical protein
MLPDEQSSPEQIRIFQAMPGEQKLRLAEQLYWSARKMKLAGLRAQHPDWTEEQLTSEVRRIFLNARSHPLPVVRAPLKPRRYSIPDNRQRRRYFLWRTSTHS